MYYFGSQGLAGCLQMSKIEMQPSFLESSNLLIETDT